MAENNKEYHSPDSLKFNYSREERYRMYSSLPIKTGAASSRKGRMIVLIDIVFLLIITSVIYPLIIKTQSTVKLGGYVLTMKKDLSDSDETLKIKLVLKKVPGASEDSGARFIDVSVKTSDNRVIEAWYEPLSETGEMEFYGTLPVPEDETLFLSIKIGNEEKTVSVMQQQKKTLFFPHGDKLKKRGF